MASPGLRAPSQSPDFSAFRSVDKKDEVAYEVSTRFPAGNRSMNVVTKVLASAPTPFSEEQSRRVSSELVSYQLV